MKSQPRAPQAHHAVCLFFCLILFSAALSCSPGTQSPPALDPQVQIELAGNTEDDRLRVDILTELRAELDEEEPANAALVLALDTLLPVAEQWAYGRERFWEPGDQASAGEDGYLAGFFNLKVWPDGVGELFPPAVDSASQIYPLWCLYRGRMLIWSAIQNDLMTEDFFADGQRCLQISAEAFPENRVARMYLGEKIPWELKDLSADGVPSWAAAQSEALGRLQAVFEWWVEERQAPDGQFGGGWGDDVEMWRRWTPLLLGFDNEVLAASQELLAEGVFGLDRMAHGYSDTMTDVEHSAEDSADTITPMLLLGRNDALWQERAAALGGLAQDLWMAQNDRGFLQFKSTYFTATEVDTSTERACDTAYHTRALQPALLLWQREGGFALSELFGEWAAGWADSAAREERGKPIGVLPSARAFPSGVAGGPGADWWNPGCHYSESTYKWPRSLAPLLTTLVLTASAREDEGLVEPVRALADLRRSWLVGGAGTPEEGTADWVASKVGGRLASALAKHRQLTGSMEFDDLLVVDGDPYVRFRLTGEEASLLESLQSSAAALRFNREAFTSEVRFTDRLVAFHGRYWDLQSAEPAPRLDTHLLYSVLTGDLGDPFYAPLPSVRWGADPRAFAGRVLVGEEDEFVAEVFSLETEETAVELQLLRLVPGTYTWTLSCGEDVSTEALEVVSSGAAALELMLPSGSLCTVRIEGNEGG